jgi:hypothetical protein
MSLDKGITFVSGKKKLQVDKVNTKSSFSNSALSYMLLQVKSLPWNAVLTKSRCWMRSLKSHISLVFPLSLFLFSRDLIKLKSPSNNQSSIREQSKLYRQDINLALSTEEAGP